MNEQFQHIFACGAGSAQRPDLAAVQQLQTAGKTLLAADRAAANARLTPGAPSSTQPAGNSLLQDEDQSDVLGEEVQVMISPHQSCI